jgi:integrase
MAHFYARDAAAPAKEKVCDMATIRERRQRDGKQRFHVQVRRTGFPTRTASFPTRRLAERWATTIEASMIEGRHFRGVEARRRTVAEMIDRYIAEELPKKKDAKTRRPRLLWWREKLGKLKLAEVSAATLVECRNKLVQEPYTKAKPGAPGSTLAVGEAAREFKRGPKTANRFLAYLSHAFATARREWHWLEHNPLAGVSKFKEGEGRVRYLLDDERDALLQQTAKDPQLNVIVMLALTTAARAGELVGLTWRDVDLKEGRLLLRKTKNSQPRVVWLHGEALQLLKEHGKVRRLDDERVFVSQKGKRYDYREAFDAACVAAKVQDFHFHDLRHSAATYLAREGATEQQLKAIGGWKSSVVSRYVHLAAQDAKDVMRKMNEKILGK